MDINIPTQRYNEGKPVFNYVQLNTNFELACTIPDLAGSEEIQSMHLAEALHTAQRPKLMLG
jgi:hypothetical protein